MGESDPGRGRLAASALELAVSRYDAAVVGLRGQANAAELEGGMSCLRLRSAWRRPPKGALLRWPTFLASQRKSLDLVRTAAAQELLGEEAATMRDPDTREANVILAFRLCDALDSIVKSASDAMECAGGAVMREKAHDAKTERDAIRMRLQVALDEFRHAWTRWFPDAGVVAKSVERDEILPLVLTLCRLKKSSGVMEFFDFIQGG